MRSAAVLAAGAASNRQRTVEAAARTIPLARRALWSLEHFPAHPKDLGMHAEYRAVLLVRAAIPDATLSECGDVLAMSKDTYAALLRRGIRYAHRLEAAQ